MANRPILAKVRKELFDSVVTPYKVSHNGAYDLRDSLTL